MLTLFLMKVLRDLMNQEGAEGRRRLYKAIKAEFPRFTQASLTNYLQGQRIPDYGIVTIISRVTGIPIFLLPFRFIHRPENAER